MKLSTIFGSLAIATALTGCGNISSEQGTALGLFGAAAAAYEAGASGPVIAAAAVAGGILGGNMGNPCQTRVSGTATEYIGSDGRRYTTQRQQTAYGCNTTGAPQGARPPAFTQ